MIYSKKSHANLARKHFIAGKISKEEYIGCLRLDECQVSKNHIHFWKKSERLYPNRAFQKKVDRLMGI